MMAPDAAAVVPISRRSSSTSPLPVNGRLKVPERPGFGVELNRSLALDRPFPH
jgi:L-rhamnonate dehydratase